jgi:hypothetical protein
MVGGMLTHDRKVIKMVLKVWIGFFWLRIVQ